MTFDIPRNRIIPIDRAELVVDPSPHPYETANRDAIVANWDREKAERPALFNGEVMFFSDIRWADRHLDARCHVVRFATYLHWRRHRPVATAEHLFAHAMPVSSDGALIAIRMGGHTANAGRVYFAAGSFDPHDVRDGLLDIAANMEREVREETGLDLSRAEPEERHYGWSGDGGTVLVRRYRMEEPADTILDRVWAHIAADPDPEITEAIAIRSAETLPEGLMPHMLPLIEWHFGG